MTYLRLFWEFFQTGLFSIGGGLATLPFLYKMSDATGWFTHAQLADMIAVSESTPGAMGVNMATYVGYNTAGLPGSIVAVFGLVLPSVVVILIIARFLSSFSQQAGVKNVLYGLRPASVALIASAGVTVIKITMLRPEVFQATGSLIEFIHWKSLILAGALWLLIDKKKMNPILAIAIAAVCGVVFRFAGA